MRSHFQTVNRCVQYQFVVGKLLQKPYLATRGCNSGLVVLAHILFEVINQKLTSRNEIVCGQMQVVYVEKDHSSPIEIDGQRRRFGFAALGAACGSQL